jgi:O-antigen biosynthesis protein
LASYLKKQEQINTVIVTPQVPIAHKSGGIGTFVWHFARLLRKHDYKVTIMTTGYSPEPDNWSNIFTEIGIDILNLHNKPLEPPPMYPWFIWLSEKVAEAIPLNTHIVYLADWQANGLHLTRSRRFINRPSPIIVTVLHGPSVWERDGSHLYPSGFEHISLDACEQYATEHSDYIIATTQYTRNWLSQHGWHFSSQKLHIVGGLPFIPTPEIHHIHDNPTIVEKEPNTKTLSQMIVPVKVQKSPYRRLIYFGRFSVRKGGDLFVQSLLNIGNHFLLSQIEEVLFIGSFSANPLGSQEQIVRLLKDELNLNAIFHTNLNSLQAQILIKGLAENALVVIPSRAETMGYTVIETSLLEDVNFIISNAGGIPEIFESQIDNRFFDPYVKSLSHKLLEYLERGVEDTTDYPRYNWEKFNDRWLNLHEDLVNQSIHRHAFAPRRNPKISHPVVDVCVTHYNLGQYLPYCLDALANQTIENFSVYVIDDGSSDEDSSEIFHEMRTRFGSLSNWHFTTTANMGPCTARNIAVMLGQAPYIIFVDADNIPTRNMVERFVEGIELSGDDCLACYIHVFEGEAGAEKGGIWSTNIKHDPKYLFIPIGGHALAAGVLENVFGDNNCIIRRSAFESINGFTVDNCLHVNHEDKELLLRLALAGYSIDVIPEVLLFYRERSTSRLRSTNHFANEQRVLRHYKSALDELNLAQLIPLIAGMKYLLRDSIEINSLDGSYQTIRNLQDEIHKMRSTRAWQAIELWWRLKKRVTNLFKKADQ